MGQWETHTLGRKRATQTSNLQLYIWPIKNGSPLFDIKETKNKIPLALMKPTARQLKTDRSQCWWKQGWPCAEGRGARRTHFFLEHGSAASNPTWKPRGRMSYTAAHDRTTWSRERACLCTQVWGNAANVLREKRTRSSREYGYKWYKTIFVLFTLTQT